MTSSDLRSTDRPGDAGVPALSDPVLTHSVLTHSVLTNPVLTGRVLLTGATGFIGRRLVRALLDAGTPVSALVLPDEAPVLPAEVQTIAGDVTDAEAVRQALARVQPERIVHLAAVGAANTGLPMREASRVNVGGAIALLEAIRELDSVGRVVMIGSSYEYGARRADDGLDPFNPYSASKVAAWAFSRAAYNSWGIPIVWVRPFQVYGPGQHRRALIPAAISAALQDADFPMTRGEQQRDFIYIDDVVGGLVAALRAAEVEGCVLDLGTGELHHVADVVARIWALTASEGQILAGALAYRPGEVSAIPANVQRTRLLTGWEAAVALDEGLQRTIAHYRDLLGETHA